MTITKSITIDGGGSMASILASATNGINVNAGANDTVILRNLSINGAGTTLGLNGINFLAGLELVVDNCTIFNFSQAGISIAPSTAGAQTTVSNSTIENTQAGVLVSTANTSGGIGVVISKTSISHNNGIGVSAVVPAGKPGMGVIVDHVSSAFNSGGIAANGNGATMWVSNSTIVGNGTGVSQTNGGSVTSFKNNVITGNAADGTPLTGAGLN